MKCITKKNELAFCKYSYSRAEFHIPEIIIKCKYVRETRIIWFYDSQIGRYAVEIARNINLRHLESANIIDKGIKYEYTKICIEFKNFCVLSKYDIILFFLIST